MKKIKRKKNRVIKPRVVKPLPPIKLTFNQHLQSEVSRLRKNEDFYLGKIERLELALMSQTPIAAAQNYAARTDSPIEQTTVEVEPPKKTWQQLSGDWRKLSEAEQEKILGWSKEPQ